MVGSVRFFRMTWLLGLWWGVPIVAAADPRPLLQAHAHNDYEHARPLFDALAQGFCCVEADVYLVDGQLLVAHERKDVKADRTLASLYLDPLRDRVRTNGGRVFRGGPGLTLLVDVKTEAEPTYAALDVMLRDYAEMLTLFRGDKVIPGAVTVIVSGNRARATIAAQALRYAAIDGRRDEIDANPPATLVPWVSMDWNAMFRWKWEGAMPEAVATELRQWTTAMHAQGRRVRFWATPDRPDVWAGLLDHGVDLISTDDLVGLSAFLNAKK